MLERERERVAEASRRLAREGLVLGTAGNVSERHGDLVAITPTGCTLERVTAEQVTVIDLQGAPVAGDLAPTSELALHLGAYHRCAAGAVVHTHAPMATALACVLDELPVIHYQMLGLGGAVPVAPYATFGSEELARVTLDALQGRHAVLMSNHGTLALGDDVEAATENTLLLEWASTMYWRAAAVGTPRLLGEAEIEAYHQMLADRSYGSLHKARG